MDAGLIQHLARELPYAAGVGLKKQIVLKKKKERIALGHNKPWERKKKDEEIGKN